MKDLYIRGIWYTADMDKDAGIYGTLTFNSVDGATLELLGSFYNDTFARPNEKTYVELIYGCTEENGSHEHVTLLKNSQIYWSNSNGKTTKIKFKSEFIFLGKHYKKLDDLRFYSLLCDYSHLLTWIDPNYIEYKFPRNGLMIPKKVPNKYISLSNVKIASHSINIGINAHFSTSIKRYSYHAHQKATFWMTAEGKDLDFESLLNNFNIANNFFKLSLLEETFPVEITLYEKKKDKNPIILYYQLNRRKESLSNMFFLSFKDIKEQFDSCFEKWFDLNNSARAICDLFIDTIVSTNKSETTIFLNLTQTLEAFHRTFINNVKLDPIVFDRRRNDLIKTFEDNDEDRKWIETILEHANEPRLRNRLNSIIEEFHKIDIGKNIVLNKGKFITSVVETRNYYTHLDEGKKDKAIEGIQLSNLNKRLQLIVIFLFLDKIGIEKSIIRESILHSNIAMSISK